LSSFLSPFVAYRTVMANAFSVCPALVADERLATHVPVYAFENDNGDTPQNNPTLPLSAFHNAGNPFLFSSPTHTLTPNQAVLGAQIVAQWSGFARTGNPTVDGTPRWPPYKRERLVMSLVSSGWQRPDVRGDPEYSTQLRVLERREPARARGSALGRSCQLPLQREPLTLT
jgi:carboxylesterase type B